MWFQELNVVPVQHVDIHAVDLERCDPLRSNPGHWHGNNFPSACSHSCVELYPNAIQVSGT